MAELELWHEWERDTKGRHFSQWSQGSREALGLGQEVSDEQLAAAEVGGELLYTFLPDEWSALTWYSSSIDGRAMAKPLRLAETGGAPTVAAYLAELVTRWRSRHGQERG